MYHDEGYLRKVLITRLFTEQECSHCYVVCSGPDKLELQIASMSNAKLNT